MLRVRVLVVVSSCWLPPSSDAARPCSRHRRRSQRGDLRGLAATDAVGIDLDLVPLGGGPSTRRRTWATATIKERVALVGKGAMETRSRRRPR
jgi:hypothetical protein